MAKRKTKKSKQLTAERRLQQLSLPQDWLTESKNTSPTPRVNVSHKKITATLSREIILHDLKKTVIFSALILCAEFALYFILN